MTDDKIDEFTVKIASQAAALNHAHEQIRVLISKIQALESAASASHSTMPDSSTKLLHIAALVNLFEDVRNVIAGRMDGGMLQRPLQSACDAMHFWLLEGRRV